MPADPAPPTQTVSRLPADLARLRDRFLAEHPTEAHTVQMLDSLPAALRHVLGLRLDLDHANHLPRRYRDLAAGNPPDPEAPDDPVTALVARFVAAKAESRSTMLPDLATYFTRPQILELLLVLGLEEALTNVRHMLNGSPIMNRHP